MLIYDIEISNAIPGGEILPDINYCKGWRDFEGMGIACIGFYYDYVEGESWYVIDNDQVRRYQLQDNDFIFDGIVELEPGHTPWQFFSYLYGRNKSHLGKTIGFNSISFDDELMQANGYDVHTDIDLLCEVRIASSQPPFYDKNLTRGGYSLNALAEANNLGSKSMSGAIAPIEWQKGNKEAVRIYCLGDVLITKQLYDLDVVNDPTDGEPLILSCTGNYDDWYKKKEPTTFVICGTEYELDQDYKENLSLLRDEDSDFVFEYELLQGLSGPEAICELWLRWQGLYEYKPDSLSSQEYINILSKVFEIGRKYGQREKIIELIRTLEDQIDDFKNQL